LRSSRLLGLEDQAELRTLLPWEPTVTLMSPKLLNLSLILTSLIGYLEWGGGQSAFLIQAEVEMLSRAWQNPAAVIHPLTLLPVLGQIALAITLFQKTPARTLTYAGIAGVGILFALMFVIAVIDMNLRIFLSTLPFLTLAVLAIRRQR
jgi:hypothetical protein